MSEKATVPSTAWNRFCRKHPFWLWALVLAIGFLTAPLMIAASRITAVLYKDF